MFEGLSLGNNFLLVDLAGRLFRDGKATISADLAGILERIGCRSGLWIDRMCQLGPIMSRLDIRL